MPDPDGHNILHDLADGLAFAYTSTNCFAGWAARNLDGTGTHLDCANAREAGALPRKAELPQDRFPDHRRVTEAGVPTAGEWEYANGQTAAAAIWEGQLA
jgi:hypothetical protein